MNFRVDLTDDQFQKLSKLAEKRGLVAAELGRRVVESFVDKRGPRKQALQAYDYQLTERQQDILWALHDCVAMTPQQIARIFTSSPNGGGTYTSKCISELVELDLVERHDLDFTPSSYSRTIYTLTSQSVFTMEVIRRGPRGVRTVRRPYPPALLEPYRLPHHLAVIDTAVAFKAVRNLPFGELVEWALQVEYRFPYMGSLRRIIPDAHGLWDNGNEFLNSFIIEVVRSRQMEHLIRKVKTYCYWWSSATYQKHEGTCTVPPILFITMSRFYEQVYKAVVHGTMSAHVTVPMASKHLVFGIALLEDLLEVGPCENIWSLPLQAVEGVTFQALLALRE